MKACEKMGLHGPGRAFASALVVATLLGACSAKPASQPAPAVEPMTLAQMRLEDAGGPTRPVLPPGMATTGDELTVLGVDWVFVELDGYGGPLPSPPPLAGFIMTSDAGLLTGTTGCNRMSSGYELDTVAGTLRFTKLRNTRMMCDRVAADTEEAVLEAMIATDAFRIAGGRLELISKGRVVARLAVAGSLR